MNESDSSKDVEYTLSNDGDNIRIKIPCNELEGNRVEMTSDYCLIENMNIYRRLPFKFFKKTIKDEKLYFSRLTEVWDPYEILYTESDYLAIKGLPLPDEIKNIVLENLPDKRKIYASYWNMRKKTPDVKYFESYTISVGDDDDKENDSFEKNNCEESAENCIIAVKSSIKGNIIPYPFLRFFKEPIYYDEELNKEYKIYSAYAKYVDYKEKKHDLKKREKIEKNQAIKILNVSKNKVIEVNKSNFASFKDKKWRKEKEIRFYVYREDLKLDKEGEIIGKNIKEKDGINVPVCLTKMIEEIYLDPRIKEKYPDYNNQIIRELKELGYGDKIKKCS